MENINNVLEKTPNLIEKNDSIKTPILNEENDTGKQNSDSFKLIIDMLTGLKPEYITPTCQRNLSAIQTLLNNVLKRSIGDFKRVREIKFTPVQKAIFVKVLKIGETKLAMCDWPTLKYKYNIPIIVSSKKQELQNLIKESSIKEELKIEKKVEEEKKLKNC